MHSLHINDCRTDDSLILFSLMAALLTASLALRNYLFILVILIILFDFIAIVVSCVSCVSCVLCFAQLTEIPQDAWFCAECVAAGRDQEEEEEDDEEDDGDEEEEEPEPV